MAVVTAQTETRNYDRILTRTRDAIMDGVQDAEFNYSPASAIFLGKTLGDFGPTPGTGSAKESQTGGESLVVRMNLGKGNSGTMAGGYGTFGTDPSDTIRQTRANWKHYWANITLSDYEMLVNSGPEKLIDTMEFETRLAMRTLAFDLASHVYSNSGSSERITDLPTIVSANDAVQGLSGATYTGFNSRGTSARGTAPGSISFAGGGFAAQGLSDMRTAWHNASEGSVAPNVILSSYSELEYYEAQLQPEMRFTSRQAGDATFASLAYKTVPWLADDLAPAGTIWLLNVGMGISLKVLSGADFNAKPFQRPTNQEVMVSEIQFKGQLCVKNRKWCNKITGVTA